MRETCLGKFRVNEKKKQKREVYNPGRQKEIKMSKSTHFSLLRTEKEAPSRKKLHFAILTEEGVFELRIS